MNKRQDPAGKLPVASHRAFQRFFCIDAFANVPEPPHVKHSRDLLVGLIAGDELNDRSLSV
jgi:hypothetical protein